MMTLEITRNGIIQRWKDGTTTLFRPHRNGGSMTEVAVPEDLADEYRLVTGDVVWVRLRRQRTRRLTASPQFRESMGWNQRKRRSARFLGRIAGVPNAPRLTAYWR